MPYFKWVGINLAGTTRTGKTFARSEHALDQLLFKRDIAMLRSSHCAAFWFVRPIGLPQKIAFFRQLSVLLRAGILLPEALVIITEQLDSLALQEVAHTISDDVSHGIPLSAALAKFPTVFDPLMIQTMYVGQEAGALAVALAMLSDNLQAKQEFNKKIRAAAMMPALTLVFFMGIALLIFTLIIPRFALIFASAQKQLPPLTRALMSISDFLLSGQIVWVLVAAVCAGIVLRAYARSPQGQLACDAFALRLPFVGDIIRHSSLMHLLRSLAMLLQSGMPLVPALRSAKNAVNNSAVRASIGYLEQNVAAGSSLSQAMTQHQEQLFGQELLSVIAVGEESGQLTAMLEHSAATYQEAVDKSLTVITTLIQPLLMIILGLLITVLIFAVYLPVFTIADLM